MTQINDEDERVILVDERDREVGFGPKLQVHRDGQLHRAFSIFVFDDSGRTLVQRRADEKYHSGGLWANTCCGHPRPAESLLQAANRRLYEELGFHTHLTPGFEARYRAELDHGMIENEYVHVFSGRSGTSPVPEPSEVQDIRYISLEALRDGTDIPSSAQTVWLRHYLTTHFDELRQMSHKPSVATLSGLSPPSNFEDTLKSTWPAGF